MPNWVRNIVHVAGDPEKIKEFLRFVRSDADNEEETNLFDFRKIVPMPDTIRNTECGSRTNGDILCYLSNRFDKSFADLSEEKSRDRCFARLLLSQDVYDRNKELFASLSDEQREESYERGKQYAKNYVEYGATTWYEWSIMNWGTKWNACDSYLDGDGSDGHVCFEFDTAWSAPEPVLRKLTEMFPKLNFEGQFADEDFGNNCGVWGGGDGVFWMDYKDDVGCSVEEARRFACTVWGYEYEEVFDRDGSYREDV